MKRFVVILCILTVLCLVSPIGYVSALSDGEVNEHYVVFNENGEYLFEKSNVQLKDAYISKSFDMYEISQIDKESKTAIAKFVKKINRPNVYINAYPSQISAEERKIGLYLTHNAESYLPTDGYDSIYGKGGIHDVAKRFKYELESLGVNVFLDETLHLPHDSKAYSRSQTTAKNMLNSSSPDAMFDVHRDGVGRSHYVADVNGEERCKIRIVVGQANPYKEQNLDFAIYLMSVAEAKFPWLFADIYYAAGHYNQALSNKLLLFEMGTYLLEKPIVLNSVAPLAEVINTALYNTTIDSDKGEIIIGGDQSQTAPTINEHLNNVQNKTKRSEIAMAIIIPTALVVGGSFAIILYFSLKTRDKKDRANKK